MQSFSKLFQKRKNIFIVVVLFLVSIIVLWLFFGNKKSQPQYQTTKVERGTIVSSVSVSGQILNSNTINVTTQASGTVKKIFIKDGTVIKKGQKILEISLDGQGQQRNAAAWSSYLSAKNTLDSTQVTAYSLQSDMFSQWKTFMDLSQNSTYQNSDGSSNETNRALPQFHIAQKDWLAAEAKYKNQQSVITQIQAALNSSWLSYQLSSPVVTAPVDGILTNLVVVEGMIVSNTQNSTTNIVSSQQIAVIQNEFKPLASFNLSEIDVSKVKPGQKATITIDSLTGKTFTGNVMTVDKIGVVSSSVTNYPVIIQFDTNIPQILPNMATSAHIILESKDDILFIPSAAIQNSGDQNMARLLKNGKEQLVPVELGIASDTQIEIISGLKEGDTVIIGTISNTGSTQTGSSPFGAGFGNRGGGNFLRR